MTEPHFADTHPMALPAASPQATRATPLGIRFTSSGSEYFRIWIVNLLLTLVTLGIYHPWAKVRRLRYFYGNTLVDGAALDFHGNPKKMLKGSALVAVLFGLYSLAGQFSPMAGLIALVLVAVIAPALVRASMQFRLANTSWRGLRFRFTGSMPEVYRAVLPLYAPAVLMVALVTFAAPDAAHPTISLWFLQFILVMVVLALAIQPWTFWKLKQYQHNHYALATQQTRFTATPGSIYILGLKILGVLLLAIAVPAAMTVQAIDKLAQTRSLSAGVTAFLLVIFMLFVMLAAVKPYAISRTQNLV